jgi:hypothetical protein
MFKIVRISILLVILALVAMSTYRSRTKSVEWQYTLPINIYPINGDGSAAADQYIRQLTIEEFRPIDEFIQREKDAFGKQANAGVEVRLKAALKEAPPAPPAEQNALEVMWWSLKFRWWAYRHAKIVGPDPQVRLFVLYFDPKNKSVHHSTALQQGLIGRVNVFADAELTQTNNVIIAHEFLHTLGATDKAYSGEIMYFSGWQDLPLLAQATAVGIPFHRGEFGWWNQALLVIVAFSVIFAVISGFVMWLKRRQPQNFSAPKVSNKSLRAVPLLLWITLAAFAYALPVFGISLALLIATEIIAAMTRSKTSKEAAA